MVNLQNKVLFYLYNNSWGKMQGCWDDDSPTKLTHFETESEERHEWNGKQQSRWRSSHTWNQVFIIILIILSVVMRSRSWPSLLCGLCRYTGDHSTERPPIRRCRTGLNQQQPWINNYSTDFTFDHNPMAAFYSWTEWLYRIPCPRILERRGRIPRVSVLTFQTTDWTRAWKSLRT